MKKFAMGAAAVVCSTVAMGAVGASPASADWHTCITHPSDPSYGCINDGRANWQTVCDRDVDGHRVRNQYIVDFGQPVYYSGWAPSGGCQTQGDYYNIIQIRVCVEDEGCSAWKHA